MAPAFHAIPTARRSGAAILILTLLVTVLSGCGLSGSVAGSALVVGKAPPSPPTRVKMGGTVVIDNVSGGLWTCSFNPFSTSVNFLSGGIFYEPLYYVNQLNAATRPWLATSYKWSNGNRRLVFALRRNVRWSDGKPLTPADVVFTFNLERRFKALDLQAVWAVLSSVTARGDNIIFSFKHPSVPFFYYIADQNFILPRHIWARVKNPVTYLDRNPVGSGPFTLGSCSPQNITYVRNRRYWQTGKPYVSKVLYPAFMDNQPGNLFLAEGKANWGGQYIPNVQAYYVSRDPTNRHIWYPPSSSEVGLYVNQTVAPLNDPKVRQAISYAIDRAKVSRLGVYGYLPPADQTGIILPNQRSWWAQDISAAAGYTNNRGYNPAKAAQLLTSAGYKRGSDGIFRSKSGQKLSLSVINVGGYTDWVAEVKIMSDGLRSVGIDLKTENLSSNDYNARESNGHFQLAYGTPTGGPTPYYMLRNLLYSANIPASNYERFNSPAVDRLFNRYAITTNPGVQHNIIRQIQQVMVSQVPFISVLEGVNWYQYDTSQIVGWPTPRSPYASPAPYNFPDWELVLMNVHRK